jgi:hypothetical protein
MIGNIKNALRGSYYSVIRKHFLRYLAKFCFCFNPQFDLKKTLPEHRKTAMFTPPMLYQLLKLAELSR